MGLFHRLQKAGIAAAPVFNALDHTLDPHLLAGGFYEDAPHPRMGPQHISRPLWLLSETPQHHRRAAPLLGEHTRQIARDLLNIGDAEVTRLISDAVLIEPAQPSRPNRST